MTCTCSFEAAEPGFEMNVRILVETAPMHMGGVVALLPAGSDSQWLPAPLTENDSLPETTLSPPVSVQPAAPFSRPPSGAST